MKRFSILIRIVETWILGQLRTHEGTKRFLDVKVFLMSWCLCGLVSFLGMISSGAAMEASERASLLQVTDEEIIVDTGRFVAAIDRSTGMIERAHLAGSEFELVSQSGGFTLFYPEFAVADAAGSYEAVWTRAPGYPGTTGLTVTIPLDDPDLAVVHVDWKTKWMEIRWTYRFLRGAPYFVVDTERESGTGSASPTTNRCICGRARSME